MMLLAHRQQTCAACGRLLEENDQIILEILEDPVTRYVAVHLGESTFKGRENGSNYTPEY
jgi:hypothetical protein